MKEKKWILKSETDAVSEAKISEIALNLGLNPIVAKLLYNRGYTTPKEAKSFLYMESEMLCNPFDMKDMEKAVERIALAVSSQMQALISSNISAP